MSQIIELNWIHVYIFSGLNLCVIYVYHGKGSFSTTMTISLLDALISSKYKEENLVAGEKNPLPQLRGHRDRATFGILFVMESGMPKTLFPFDHDKETYSILDLVWNKFRSNNWYQSLLFIGSSGYKVKIFWSRSMKIMYLFV